MSKLNALGQRTSQLRPLTYHYLHLAESSYRRAVAGKETVPLKKYFYCLRPALALRWIRMQSGNPVPMDLPTLRTGVNLPDDVSQFIDDLLVRKATTRELGNGPRVQTLDNFIEGEIDFAKNGLGALPPARANLINEASALFRDLVKN